MQLCDLLIVTLLFFISTVNCEPLKRSERSLYNPMESAQSATSNMAQFPWYGPALPWFPYDQSYNFPNMPPMPDAHTIMKNVQDQIKATSDNIKKQIAQNSIETQCDPVDVTTENFTVGGTKYTVIKKTCKNGADGGLSSSSTIIAQDASGSNSGTATSSSTSTGSSSNSGSGSSSSVTTATTSDSTPSQGSTSDSTSGATSSSSSVGDSSVTQTNQDTKPEVQNQNNGSAASSAAMASSGNGGAVASATSTK